jgi:hypothetical protein
MSAVSLAAAIARCTCTENPADDTLVLRLPRQAVLRPKGLADSVQLLFR